MNIKVLDVTLRDGGCVINFNFGDNYMRKIISALVRSNVDIVELGYIDSAKGSESGRSQFKDDVVIQNYINRQDSHCEYVAMIDYGKFNPNELSLHSDCGIDGVRFCFHKKDYKDAIRQAKIILEKGFKLFIQPMITMRYSKEEFLDLINMINQDIPQTSGVYIVDSFGEMREKDLITLFDIADKALNKNISLGFHSHNNLQLSYSNVISLLKHVTDRNIILDSSIMGMGKGAGNLNTELLLEHLNLFYDKAYNIDPLLEVIDKVIKPIHSENYWGYSVEYFLSSKYQCTPSYASHFYNKHMLPIADISNLLSMIEEHKKISFDKNYAEEIYKKYNSSKDVDDSDTIALLKEKMANKKALLIAPGKSISLYKNDIDKIINNPEFVSITLNIIDLFNPTYRLITRKELYCDDDNCIYLSNALTREHDFKNVVSYKKWTTKLDDSINDSSSVVAINILKHLGVKEIYLAGFDGFSFANSDNYYKEDLRNELDIKQVEKRNQFYIDLFADLSKHYRVKFVTPSKYEN